MVMQNDQILLSQLWNKNNWPWQEEAIVVVETLIAVNVVVLVVVAVVVAVVVDDVVGEIKQFETYIIKIFLEILINLVHKKKAHSKM